MATYWHILTVRTLFVVKTIIIVISIMIFSSKTVYSINKDSPEYKIEEGTIYIETDCYTAQIKTEKYVTGVAGGTFRDKKTGAVDLGFGLDIVDFLLKPGKTPKDTPEEFKYNDGDKIHGNLPKQYIELPQICTQVKKLPYEIIKGEDFIAVKQWYRWEKAAPGYEPGSLWEQYLVFPMGKRYFYAVDRITSVNTVEEGLILRTDLPGHLKHTAGNNFECIYLSYHGFISSSAFLENFAPDEKYLYQRGTRPVPKRMIRAYQINLNNSPGPFLAGMTLNPEIVYEAWCHQRNYVCFIQEIGGFPIKTGQNFSAAYIIGFFDSLEEMNNVYDKHKGWNSLKFIPNFKNARKFIGVK
jgi:hypothetical protein